jgi:soluble lytic murein transglycosylase-like protein
MSRVNKVGLVVGLLAIVCPAFASDIAMLHNGFAIRHERREAMGPMTRLYLGTDKAGYVDIATDQIERFEKDVSPPAMMLAPPPARLPTLNEVINTISDRHHIDPDLVNSVIHAESGFNPRAVSPKGARGLMQLMPQTASRLGVSNAFDPRSNVEGGTRYLSELLQRYNFDLIKALAAYNAGPQRVEQYRGVPPYNETRAYVAKIVRDFNRKKIAQRKAATGKAKAKTAVPTMVKQAAIPSLPSQTVR